MTTFVLILWMLHGPATSIQTREPISLQTQQFADKRACERALEAMLSENRPDIRYSFDGMCVAQASPPPPSKKRTS